MKIAAHLLLMAVWMTGFLAGFGFGLSFNNPKSAPVRDKAMPSTLEYRGPKPEPERLSFTF